MDYNFKVGVMDVKNQPVQGVEVYIYDLENDPTPMWTSGPTDDTGIANFTLSGDVDEHGENEYAGRTVYFGFSYMGETFGRVEEVLGPGIGEEYKYQINVNDICEGGKVFCPTVLPNGAQILSEKTWNNTNDESCECTCTGSGIYYDILQLQSGYYYTIELSSQCKDDGGILCYSSVKPTLDTVSFEDESIYSVNDNKVFVKGNGVRTITISPSSDTKYYIVYKSNSDDGSAKFKITSVKKGNNVYKISFDVNCPESDPTAYENIEYIGVAGINGSFDECCRTYRKDNVGLPEFKNKDSLILANSSDNIIQFKINVSDSSSFIFNIKDGYTYKVYDSSNNLIGEGTDNSGTYEMVGQFDKTKVKAPSNDITVKLNLSLEKDADKKRYVDAPNGYDDKIPYDGKKHYPRFDKSNYLEIVDGYKYSMSYLMSATIDDIYVAKTFNEVSDDSKTVNVPTESGEIQSGTIESGPTSRSKKEPVSIAQNNIGNGVLVGNVNTGDVVSVIDSVSSDPVYITDVGTLKVTVKYAVKKEYKDTVAIIGADSNGYKEVTSTVTVDFAKINANVSDQKFTYDGNPHGKPIDDEVTTVNNQEFTIMYGSKYGSYPSSVAPRITKVNESKTIFYKITAKNHITKSGNYKLSINKRGSGFYITPEKKVLYKDVKQFTIKTNIDPSEVVFESENKRVALVSKDGTVKYQNPGTAIITARLTGNGNYERISKTCKVICKEKKPEDVNYTRLDDDVSFQLLRTNPKLTTNTKLMYDGEKLFLESYSANALLSSNNYKHKKILKSGLFNSDISSFIAGTGSGAYDVGHKMSDLIIGSSFDNQFETMYWCGCESINSDVYPQEMGFVAPLYLRKKRPNYFVIFKIDNPANTNLKSDVQDYSYNFESDIRQNARILKSFDLREGTPIGDYIKKYTEQKDFKYDSSIYVNFSSKEICYYGIDRNTGTLTQKVEDINSNLLENDNTILKNDNWITSGFERNDLIFPYILNIEFLFDDNEAQDFEFARYFGVYCNDIELTNISVRDLDPVNKNNIQYNSIYTEWEDLNLDSINMSDDSFYYIKDKKDNIFTIDHKHRIIGDIKEAYFKGYELTSVSAYCERVEGLGFASMMFKPTKNIVNNDSIVLKKPISDTKFKVIKQMVASDSMEAGSYNKNRFSCKGTTSDIAKAVAGLINDYIGKVSTYTYFEGDGVIDSGSIDVIKDGDEAISDEMKKAPAANNTSVNYNTDVTDTNEDVINVSEYNGRPIVPSYDYFKRPDEDYNWITAYAVDDVVVVQSMYPGASVNDLIQFDFTKDKFEKLMNSFSGGTDDEGSLFKIHKYDAPLFVDESGKDQDPSRYLRSKSYKKNAHVLTIMPYFKDDGTIDEEYMLIVTDDNGKYVNLSNTKMVELVDKYYPKVGVLSMFPVKDFDFDTVYSSYGEDTMMENELTKLKDFLEESGQIGSIGAVNFKFNISINDKDDEYPYFNQNNDLSDLEIELIPTKERTRINEYPFLNSIAGRFFDNTGVKIENEYEYYCENVLPSLSTVSKTVPYITKWGYIDDSKDSCENPYRLNTSKIFGTSNFSANTFVQNGDITEYTHSMPYYVSQRNGYDDPTKSDINEYQYIYSNPNNKDELIVQERTNDDENDIELRDFKDKWINKFKDEENDFFYEMFGDTSTSYFKNKRFRRKYSRFLGGSKTITASTLFRGVKFEIKDLINGKEVSTSRFNDYRFSFIYIPVNELFSNRVWFVRNDKFKFIVGISFFCITDAVNEPGNELIPFNKANVYGCCLGYDVYNLNNDKDTKGDTIVKDLERIQNQEDSDDTDTDISIYDAFNLMCVNQLKKSINEGKRVTYIGGNAYTIKIVDPDTVNVYDVFRSSPVILESNQKSVVGSVDVKLKTDINDLNLKMINRYSGYYNPIFKDILFFNDYENDNQLCPYSNTEFDFDYKDNYGSFGVIRNMWFHKVNDENKNIITTLEPYYPIIGQYALDYKDYNIFGSSWDKDYYTKQLDIKHSEKCMNIASMKNELCMFGSKYLNVPEKIEIESFLDGGEWNRDWIDNPENCPGEVMYEEINNNNADFYFFLRKRLIRYFTNMLMDEFKKYINPKYSYGLTGDSDYYLSDDIEAYVEKNILKLYRLKKIRVFVKSEKKGINNRNIENNYKDFLGYSIIELKKNRFKEVKNISMTKVTTDEFDRKVVYNLKNDEQESFGFSFIVEKI